MMAKKQSAENLLNEAAQTKDQGAPNGKKRQNRKSNGPGVNDDIMKELEDYVNEKK